MPAVAGLLLAAGAGRRMGLPKALVRERDGEAWVTRSARRLVAGGCDPVLVVAGARADEVRPLVPAGCPVVVAPDWDEGMGASLRAGLRALTDRTGTEAGVVAVVIGLVDTPGVGAAVIERLVGRAGKLGTAGLARAAYHGVPGHPVVLGRAHWAGVIEQAAGDAGARGYLAGRDVVPIECADVGDGRDVDA